VPRRSRRNARLALVVDVSILAAGHITFGDARPTSLLGSPGGPSSHSTSLRKGLSRCALLCRPEQVSGRRGQWNIRCGEGSWAPQQAGRGPRRSPWRVRGGLKVQRSHTEVSAARCCRSVDLYSVLFSDVVGPPRGTDWCLSWAVCMPTGGPSSRSPVRVVCRIPLYRTYLIMFFATVRRLMCSDVGPRSWPHLCTAVLSGAWGVISVSAP